MEKFSNRKIFKGRSSSANVEKNRFKRKFALSFPKSDNFQRVFSASLYAPSNKKQFKNEARTSCLFDSKILPTKTRTVKKKFIQKLRLKCILKQFKKGQIHSAKNFLSQSHRRLNKNKQNQSYSYLQIRQKSHQMSKSTNFTLKTPFKINSVLKAKPRNPHKRMKSAHKYRRKIEKIAKKRPMTAKKLIVRRVVKRTKITRKMFANSSLKERL